MTNKEASGNDVNVHESNVDEFGRRMNVAIERAGGATKMAEKAGVSGSVLRKWRSGQSEPTRSNLIRIAVASDVSVEWLATGNGTPDHPSPSSDLDPKALELAIDVLEQVLKEHGYKMHPHDKAGLTVSNYQLIKDASDRNAALAQIRLILQRTLSKSWK